MADTVEMARLEREKQGELEVEITYEGDAYLQKHFQECKKNPGHTKFIPVDEFNVNHLPDGCRDEDLVELVRALADLTVRVSVKYVSEDRPETEPGRDTPYPCYKVRGTNMERVGSGWVYFVDKYPDENGLYTPCFCNDCLLSPTPKVCKCEKCLEYDSPTTCQCHECLNSGKPKTRFAHIVMLTAVHNVYDDMEGAQTTCHLFFDNGDEPEKCARAVTLKGMFRVRSYDARDWCEMTFVTHDMDLADRLEEMQDRWESIMNKIKKKYKPLLDEGRQATPPVQSVAQTSALSAVPLAQTSALSAVPVAQTSALSAVPVAQTSALSAVPVAKTSAVPVPETLKTLTLLVSHPHGCSKMVSVGSYTRRDVMVPREGQKSELATYTYTTPTCRGSSGGPVIILARSWRGFYDTHIHRGGRQVKPLEEQSNYTCVGSELTESDFNKAGTD